MRVILADLFDDNAVQEDKDKDKLRGDKVEDKEEDNSKGISKLTLLVRKTLRLANQ